MEILYVLLVLLLVTRAFGELAERLGQPALVGELTSGVVLGIVATSFDLPVLSELDENEVFHAITDLGIFFLMLMAGLELRPRDLAKASKEALAVALGGMLLPLGLGVALGWWALPPSELRGPQILFLGVALAITAVPVAVRILMDLGRLDSRIGRIVVSAALVDDVLSLLLLAVLTAVLESGSFPSPLGLLLVVVKAAAFFTVVVIAGGWMLPWAGRRVQGLRGPEFEFTFLLVVALGFAVLAEMLGMHFILGAFGAGLFFSRRTIDSRSFESLEKRVSALSTGFLGPVFFASIGFHLDLEALGETPGFVVLLVGAATAGKVLGAAVPARLAGLGGREALTVAAAMNARGAVELVIAGIAFRAGLFTAPDPPPPIVANLFSAVVVMAMVTTLTTPIAMKALLRRSSSAAAGSEPEGP